MVGNVTGRDGWLQVPEINELALSKCSTKDLISGKDSVQMCDKCEEGNRISASEVGRGGRYIGKLIVACNACIRSSPQIPSKVDTVFSISKSKSNENPWKDIGIEVKCPLGIVDLSAKMRFPLVWENRVAFKREAVLGEMVEMSAPESTRSLSGISSTTMVM